MGHTVSDQLYTKESRSTVVLDTEPGVDRTLPSGIYDVAQSGNEQATPMRAQLEVQVRTICEQEEDRGPP